jgi:hypothetical protein
MYLKLWKRLIQKLKLCETSADLNLFLTTLQNIKKKVRQCGLLCKGCSSIAAASKCTCAERDAHLQTLAASTAAAGGHGPEKLK